MIQKNSNKLFLIENVRFYLLSNWFQNTLSSLELNTKRIYYICWLDADIHIVLLPTPWMNHQRLSNVCFFRRNKMNICSGVRYVCIRRQYSDSSVSYWWLSNEQHVRLLSNYCNQLNSQLKSLNEVYNLSIDICLIELDFWWKNQFSNTFLPIRT